MSEGGVEALAALDAALDQLLNLDLSMLPGPDCAALFTGLERHRRRLEALDHTVVAQLKEAHLAGEFGATSVADLMVDLTRITPAEAKARVHAARDMGPRREPCGLPLSPIFSHVAAAQRDGSISPAHAKVITRTVAAIPARVAMEASEPAERLLVEHAHHLDPKRLMVAADRLLATIDPAGAAPSAAEQQRRRSFGVSRTGQGFWRTDGWVTDEFAALFTAVIDPLAAPQPAADGLPDDRS